MEQKKPSIIAILLIGALVITGSYWLVTNWQAEQTYKRKIEEEQQYFQEQLVALEKVSPSTEELLTKLGIDLVVKKAISTTEEVIIEYALDWNTDSQVEWITTDRHRFKDDMVIDGASGTPLRLTSSGSGSSRKSFNGSIKSKTDGKEVDKVIIKTEPLYAFIEEYIPRLDIKFRYVGDSKTIDINKKFRYGEMEFSIDSLELTEAEFKVNYRQLTPASEVGVYLLNFTFDDRLGNQWEPGPEAELAVTNPKQFTLKTPHSPSKNWLLKVKHVVQVIPGINTEIDLEGGDRYAK